VWIEEHLGIAVNGQKGLEVAVRFHKVHNGFDFWLGMSTGSMVSLRARVIAGTRTYRRKSVYNIVKTVNSIYINQNQYPKHAISPPKPVSQFLLGSTPTQLEPGFGFLVLRHMRSLINQPIGFHKKEGKFH